MAMTEAEAKTKTCPQSFGVAAEYDGNGNGIRQGGPFSCVGSDCMAWRWKVRDVSSKLSKTPVDGWEHISAEDAMNEYDIKGEVWREPDAEAQLRRPGYCGLAGRP